MYFSNMIDIGVLENFFVEAQMLETAAVDQLFDELWKAINSSPGNALDELLARIRTWVATKHTTESFRFLALADFTLAYAGFFSANYSQSAIYCHRALEIFRELDDGDGIGITMVLLGNNYRSLGANELAIECYLRARLHQNGKYPLTDLGSSYQLAEVYVEMGNYQEALPLLDQALQLVRHGGFAAWWEPRIINSKANALVKLGETTKGLAAFKTALSISRRNNFLPVTARALTDVADHFHAAGDWKRAIRYNEKALTIREKLDIRNGCITNLLSLATIYQQQGDDIRALSYLQAAGPLALSLGMKAKQARIHELFSIVFEQSGEIGKSLEHYKAYHQIKEEASAEDADRKVKNYQQVIEAEQTSRENVLIRKQKSEIEQKNTELQVTIDELVLARDQLRREKQRSDDLLLNILPEEVAAELKEHGSAEARQYTDVTVLFTDFKGFTTTAERLSPRQLVAELHTCFSRFDEIVEKNQVEKIKTVGDAYLAVCGLPVSDSNHARNILLAAMEIRDFMLQRRLELGDLTFEVRIGVHTGSVVAGIVGVKKFAYDVWGDTVNTAARMEQNGEAGKINISESTYQLVKHEFNCIYRGMIAAKNKGELGMYFLNIQSPAIEV